MDCSVGAVIFSTDLQIEKSIPQPILASVFQAEVLPIKVAYKIIAASELG